MTHPIESSVETDLPNLVSDAPRDPIWAGLIGFAFVASMALAYRPTFDTAGHIGLAIAPWLVLAALLLAWSGTSRGARLSGISIAIVGWLVLAVSDDRWTLLSFALYGLCFIIDSTRLRVGVTLAGLVSASWLVASLGGPTWTLAIPVFVFFGASTVAYAIHRIGGLTSRQAELIRQLESTQQDLARSERSRGVLEERTRMAGEIHDTLAQGFTSIVLLARTGTRPTADPNQIFDSIESTAQENLDTARRLVEASRPDELEEVSLPDALRRHMEVALPDSIDGNVEIVGSPHSLPGSLETVLLRAAQEGIRNACVHAAPSRVDVTLSYLDETVTLGVRDDGNGVEAGHVHDRGALTGGQGLGTLARRVETLSGQLTIEPGDVHGSVLTVQFPVEP